ncbi:MAG: DNA repair protein RadA [Euzebyales bacterium]|nr:DNA repair protein RadA [Euzebyales bacterium]
MPRIKTFARCTECGRVEPKWVGHCPGCEAWGTLVEEQEAAPTASAGNGAAAAAATPRVASRPALSIRDVRIDDHRRVVTGIIEFDRVVGGGLVPGSVALVGGEPGAGKSTLLLQAAQALAEAGSSVLYVSAEESPGQVRLRADRLSALHERVLLASETELVEVLALIEHHRPDVLVLDSIQTVRLPGVGGAAGGAAQVRECAAALVAAAKARHMATVLVGHVTKDGQLAGPRVLEHLVDTVCELTGDRHHALRLLRATKNRFGPVGEVGCFEMVSTGMRSVVDAGRLFVGETEEGTAGVAVTVALEGARALACEVQALVTPTSLANPRRVASGLDGQRLALLLAVLERRAEVKLSNHDVYVSSVGGLRLVEPAVDLALVLALASGRWERPVAAGAVALGEVGLAGELRLVARTEARLKEAARMGFSGALLPAAYDGHAYGLRLHRARDVRGALLAGLA